MTTRENAKLFAKDLIRSLTLYCLIVAGGTALLLFVASAVGYLPYSDRPGPGWHGAHIPGLREIGFYFSFAIFFAITSAYCGEPPFSYLYDVWVGFPRHACLYAWSEVSRPGT